MKPKRVVLIGCGGIGSWLIDPLLCFLQSEKFAGPVCLWDGDRYEDSNSVRQMFKPGDLNANKAVAQVERCRELYPGLDLMAYDEYVTVKNVDRVIRESDIVISGVDNDPCRLLLAEKADQIDNLVMLTAGNDLKDGNVHLTFIVGGEHQTASLLERHPEVRTRKEGDRSKGCQNQVAQGVTQLLVTNHAAAASAFQLFHWLWKRAFSIDGLEKLPQELYFDIEALQMSGPEVRLPHAITA